jgi:hypothetical protein
MLPWQRRGLQLRIRTNPYAARAPDTTKNAVFVERVPTSAPITEHRRIAPKMYVVFMRQVYRLGPTLPLLHATINRRQNYSIVWCDENLPSVVIDPGGLCGRLKRSLRPLWRRRCEPVVPRSTVWYMSPPPYIESPTVFSWAFLLKISQW